MYMNNTVNQKGQLLPLYIYDKASQFVNYKYHFHTFSTRVTVVVQFVAIATKTLVKPVNIVANMRTAMFGAAFVDI